MKQYHFWYFGLFAKEVYSYWKSSKSKIQKIAFTNQLKNTADLTDL